MANKCKEEIREEILARARLLRGDLVRGVLLKVDEAAEYLRMAPPTLYQNKDNYPHFPAEDGRPIMFDSADLDDKLRNSKSSVSV